MSTHEWLAKSVDECQLQGAAGYIYFWSYELSQKKAGEFLRDAGVTKRVYESARATATGGQSRNGDRSRRLMRSRFRVALFGDVWGGGCRVG